MATVMTAVVPAGVGEGMMMQVQTPSGPMQVQIPPGMKEGMQFQFGVAAPTVQPMAAVPMAAAPVQPMAAVPMAATPVVQVAGGGGHTVFVDGSGMVRDALVLLMRASASSFGCLFSCVRCAMEESSAA